MGSTLGSNSRIPHLPRYGNEYLWDPGNILKATLSLGFHSKAWDAPRAMKHPTIGYFENDTFRPGNWVPSYPNPAFQWCTNRDGYWGAKIVTAFNDEDVAAIVRTGKLTSPEAEAELTRLLIERRDMIGRYWFDRVNPLDRFHVETDAVRSGRYRYGRASPLEWLNVESHTLRFVDLAVARGLANPAHTRYRYRRLNANGRPLDTFTETDEMRIPIRDAGTETYQGIEIHTRRETGWGKAICVFIHTNASGKSTVVGIDREE